MQETAEPKGIGFFNVKSGDTHYAKLEPTIQAYINSSDMGINASRGQDFGWKLEAEWVKRVKAFRRDTMQMSILTARNSGQKPTTVQILYFLYGEDLRAYEEEADEHENPFEDQYQRDIADKRPKAAPQGAKPEQLPTADDGESEDMAGVIDEAINEDSAAEAATSDEPKATAKPAKPSQK